MALFSAERDVHIPIEEEVVVVLGDQEDVDIVVLYIGIQIEVLSSGSEVDDDGLVEVGGDPLLSDVGEGIGEDQEVWPVFLMEVEDPFKGVVPEVVVEVGVWGIVAVKGIVFLGSIQIGRGAVDGIVIVPDPFQLEIDDVIFLTQGTDLGGDIAMEAIVGIFDLLFNRSWILDGEVLLYHPDDIGITAVKEASERFHSRYNASKKTYT